LINIGSDVAFNAIISLNLVALMLSYMISIGCVLYRRIKHPELLPPARWSLGRAGIPINAIGLLYSAFAFFWCFWPESKEVTLEGFNWAILMFIVLAIGSTVDFFVRARKSFKGPVTIVQGWHQDHRD
jgi:amino acid transporter